MEANCRCVTLARSKDTEAWGANSRAVIIIVNTMPAEHMWFQAGRDTGSRRIFRIRRLNSDAGAEKETLDEGCFTVRLKRTNWVRLAA